MKKIRVTVPEDIWRMMKNDIEEFGINNNKLCNYILEKLKYKKEIDVEKDLESQGRPVKKIIQSLTLMFPTKRYIMMYFVTTG